MKATSRSWVFGLSAVLLASATSTLGQTAPPPGEKISGAQLQTWLDQKFGYAGVHQPSQCVLLNTADKEGRVLFLRCPDGWAEKLTGSARVNGDSYCTIFAIPNTPPGEDCVTWHSLGQWKFEQRKGNETNTIVILLPFGLQPSK